jgi:two-component system response regulator PhoP
VARIKALIRRAAGHASPRLEIGSLTLDTSAREVYRDGALLELTAFEYRVLEYLMLHAGAVVSKPELTEQLYDQDFERDSNVIEVFVGRLRRKLAPLEPIRTVRGQGYRFEP